MAEATSSSGGVRRSEEDLQETVVRLFESSKSLCIITVGKAGAGKSSLVRDILGPDAKERPHVQEGMQPGTLQAKSYHIPIGDVFVSVYDTRGMFDLKEGNHECETLRLVREICLNDVHGVLLVCIEMHQRVDKSTMETLALIHRQCGKEIWRFAVIALTKADQYPTSEWLESTKWWQRQQPILENKFKENLAAAKDYLRFLFTSTDVTNECCIGLTREEFDDLAIPILPTSMLSYQYLSKMEVVDHESWFDRLLVECCRREGGIAIVKIHSNRLWHLPSAIVAQLDPTGIFGPCILDFVREVMKSGFGKSALILAWKIYWSKYSSQVMNSPRFEQIRQTQ